ncbi:MAG TPA: response regulator [Candidatus Dormibacteraeota bacterium]|nr:response regulator [Candidatus Dormibacteraeota bacterium]
MSGGSPSAKSVNVLLVEDNPADVELTRLSLEETRLAHKLHVTQDGDQAMAFLKRRAPYAAAPRPDLTLLDLNLPRRDGRAVLAEIKSDERLKDIPVVILTTSAAERDILHAYRMHANSYITKPLGVEDWIRLFRTLQEFWFGAVTLPPGPPSG